MVHCGADGGETVSGGGLINVFPECASAYGDALLGGVDRDGVQVCEVDDKALRGRCTKG